MAAKRTRDKSFLLRMTEDEKKRMSLNAQKAGGLTMQNYLLSMGLDGYIIKEDYSEEKKLTKSIAEYSNQMQKIGININQISKKANENNFVFDNDLEEIKQEFEKMEKDYNAMSEIFYTYLLRKPRFKNSITLIKRAIKKSANRKVVDNSAFDILTSGAILHDDFLENDDDFFEK